MRVQTRDAEYIRRKMFEDAATTQEEARKPNGCGERGHVRDLCYIDGPGCSTVAIHETEGVAKIRRFKSKDLKY